MTLLDAKQYDPEKSRKKRIESFPPSSIVIVVAFLGWWFRYWPEERVVGHFFEALQKQDYNTAYGIWMHDPQLADSIRASIQNILFNEFYQRLGAGRRVGPRQDYREYMGQQFLPRRRQRCGCGFRGK